MRRLAAFGLVIGAAAVGFEAGITVCLRTCERSNHRRCGYCGGPEQHSDRCPIR